MAKGTRFTDEFKTPIVSLYKNGRAVRKLAADYDIAVPTIYKWIKESNTTGSFKMTDNLTDEQKELRELRKQNAQLEIIKFFTSIYVKQLGIVQRDVSIHKCLMNKVSYFLRTSTVTNNLAAK